MDGQKRKAVELSKNERAKDNQSELLKIFETIGLQTNLLINISRRQETTKDELRHLAISLQYTALQGVSTTRREHERFKTWRFGAPLTYLVNESELESDREKTGCDSDVDEPLEIR